MAHPGSGTNPTDSANWCAIPPHMAAAPQSTGSTLFASAHSQPAPGTVGTTSSLDPTPQNGMDPVSLQHLSDISSGSPTPSTLSQDRPLSGIIAHVVSGPDGTPYLVHDATGMRIDVIDDSSVMTPEELANLRLGRTRSPTEDDGTPSDTSDLPETTSGKGTTGANPVVNLEQMLAGFLDGLDPQTLSTDNLVMLNTVRGYMSTSRDRLLATTGIMVDQQTDSKVLHQKLIHVQNEVSVHLADLHADLSSHHDRVHDAVNTNIQSLREIGVAENFISKLLRDSGSRKVGLKPSLPIFQLGPATPLDETIRAEVDAALPPRTAHETSADFAKRAESTLNRKDRAASVFALNANHFKPQAPIGYQPVGTNSGQNHRARFVDTSSISAPNGTNYTPGEPTSVFMGGISQHGYLTAVASDGVAIDAMAQFAAETEALLTALIDQQLGDSLDLPARVKSPKLDQPGKYSGSDNYVRFISWIEHVTTWMRAMQYGGQEASVAEFRVTILWTLLDRAALDWYLEYVENLTHPNRIEKDLVKIICALHRRFVSSSTAQQASDSNQPTGPLS
ncbi:hypothetical protein C8J57DRAFT_1514615 [Mycena rebaudengoi]|nr:hypothetical protein C8J57DRAFT_1514615 [Mycena rebaudengoi]